MSTPSLKKLLFAVCAALALAFVLLLAVPARAALPTLAQVKLRGHLICGVNGQLPGFSMRSDKGEWSGFEVDVCRAFAAAIFGDAKKVQFVALTPGHRFEALSRGDIDVLVRNSTATLERTATRGIRDAAVIFLEGQVAAVSRASGIASIDGLGGRPICVLNNTSYSRNMRDLLTYRGHDYKPVPFDSQQPMYAAFLAGKCDAVTQDIAALSATLAASGRAADFIILPHTIALQPNAAFVRAGDDQWLDVVRWTIFALLDAEDRGVVQSNAELQSRIGPDATRRLLGMPSDDGKLLGLSGNWAYDAIRLVGNYGEIFERNLGQDSPFRFPRGLTALWNRGGVMFALPLR